jgi:uncharacterized protein with PIN domain
MLNEFDRDEFEDYAVGHNICPKCLGTLEIHKWKEPREFWGSKCYQDMEELWCQECHETY